MRSMTAFARGKGESSFGTITIELKSVNHRYLEPNFRLPERFKELEAWMRDTLKNRVSRGKFDISLNYQFSAREQTLEIDSNALDALTSACSKISDQCLNPLEILKWPGILIETELDLEEAIPTAKLAFKEALELLVENREREGAATLLMIKDRLDKMRLEASNVAKLMPELLAAQKEKLEQKLADFKASLDEGRVEAEFVILAQKADIDEELDRLAAHLDEVDRVIHSNNSIGRRLDFLMQELNREANTLSSKSFSAVTTNAAVEMKVLIEQMREQIQNIE